MAIRRTRRVSHARRKGSKSKASKRNARRGRKLRTRRHAKRTERAPRRRTFRKVTRRYRGGIADLRVAHSGRSLADPSKLIAHTRQATHPERLASSTNWAGVNKSLNNNNTSTTGKTPATSSHRTITKAQAEAVKNQIASDAGGGITWAPLEATAGTAAGLIVIVGGMQYLLSNKKVNATVVDKLIDKHKLTSAEVQPGRIAGQGAKKIAEDENTVTFRYGGRDYTIPKKQWDTLEDEPTAKAMADAEADAQTWDTKGMGRTSFQFKGKNEGFSSETQSLDDSGQVVKAEFSLDPGKGITVSYGSDSKTIPLDELLQSGESLDQTLAGSGKTIADVSGRALGSSGKVDATTIGNFVAKGMKLDESLVTRFALPEGGVAGINSAVSDALTSEEGTDVTSALDGLESDI